jgi:2-keto-4-pentenoate hydratase/2-oxohepta-3-ene-1,7-dioic acid hydratase in catechol pathway
MTMFGFATLSSGLAVRTGRSLVPLDVLLGQSVEPHDVYALLPAWDAWTDAVTAALSRYEGPWLSEQTVTFLPPVTHRPAVYCAGANYQDHVAEMGRTESQAEPYHFLMPPAALAGHRGIAIRPPGMQRLDWEAELVAVIGRRADAVTPEQALEYVAGYTIANDLSCRDERAMSTGVFGIHWLLQKGWRGLKPIGPAIVPARFVPDPGALRIRLSVNGEVRQDSDTGQMIFAVPQQISALSALVPLEPGDLILTGTPAGTAAAHGHQYLTPGDHVEAEIEGLGQLATVISGI